MPENEALKYLEDELAKQALSFDDSRKFYRRNYFYYTLATASLSALTTILIGIGQSYESKLLSVISLITSASITVVAAWDGFLRSRELWVQKTDTWMALQNLDANIKYAKAKSGGVLAESQIDDFYQRFDKILMGEHELWKKVRSTQTESTKKS
ncbi:SLATT domain-containing protein [Methylomagnum ishizawai]|uniref:SLATT domain-containing protein n=1 Tax=Methylomagnum ishizawai TaxID=1760988 RepID=UPI000F74A77C|nr:SLATT domain-containing protein [Methylomagnum ishizawai]